LDTTAHHPKSIFMSQHTSTTFPVRYASLTSRILTVCSDPQPGWLLWFGVPFPESTPPHLKSCLRASLGVQIPDEIGGAKISLLKLNKEKILAPSITFGFVAPKLAPNIWPVLPRVDEPIKPCQKNLLLSCKRQRQDCRSPSEVLI
jgi:hypothetical protein